MRATSHIASSAVPKRHTDIRQTQTINQTLMSRHHGFRDVCAGVRHTALSTGEHTLTPSATRVVHARRLIPVENNRHRCVDKRRIRTDLTTDRQPSHDLQSRLRKPAKVLQSIGKQACTQTAPLAVMNLVGLPHLQLTSIERLPRAATGKPGDLPRTSIRNINIRPLLHLLLQTFPEISQRFR